MKKLIFILLLLRGVCLAANANVGTPPTLCNVGDQWFDPSAGAVNQEFLLCTALNTWTSTLGRVMQNQGSSLPYEPNLNFTGAGVSCADVPASSQTTCTIPGGGGITPTGTGFTHNTSGSQDAASKLVSLTASTDIAANQGTTTQVLHGNASGQASWTAVVDGDITPAYSGTGTPTACTNQFVTGFTLARNAAPTSTCTTDILASAQHANQGTTTTVLHGNAAGNPTFASIGTNDIASSVTLTTPVLNHPTIGISGTSTSSHISTVGTAPTCTFTSGGGTSPSCTIGTGGTDAGGTITMTTGTGSPGSTGTITLTFNATYSTNTTFPVVAMLTTSNWGNCATIRQTTRSLTAPVFTWTNSTCGSAASALAASTAFGFSYIVLGTP